MEEALSSKISTECSCSFNRDDFHNSSIQCTESGDLVYRVSVEYSTDDGTETASIIAERIIGQTPFSLNVEGVEFMVTSACSSCGVGTSTVLQATYTQASAGSASSLSIGGIGAGLFVAGFVTAALVIGIILLIVM